LLKQYEKKKNYEARFKTEDGIKIIFIIIFIIFFLGHLGYKDIVLKKKIYEREKSQKLTWDQLDKINCDHFISKRDDDFNVNNILDDNDYESDEAQNFIDMRKQLNDMK